MQDKTPGSKLFLPGNERFSKHKVDVYFDKRWFHYLRTNWKIPEPITLANC